MKKRITLIASLAIALGVCVIVGFVGMPNINDNPTANEYSAIESQVEEIQKSKEITSDSITNKNFAVENQSEKQEESETSKEATVKTNTNIDATEKSFVIDNQTNEESKTTASNNAITTEKIENIKKFKDDAAVKAEIEKYVDTDVDFKLNKQETINGKAFNITFSEFNNIVTNREKAIYKNDLGDSFEFDAKSGRLCTAVINSLVTPKTDESVTEDEAKTIAIEYAKTRCDIDKYSIESYKESEKGHGFVYTRYIGGYPSSDKFSIRVGYDGNIVFLNDNTTIFEGDNLNFEKSFIDSKIKEYSDEAKVDWESIWIEKSEGKICVSYAIPEQCAICILPLE